MSRLESAQTTSSTADYIALLGVRREHATFREGYNVLESVALLAWFTDPDAALQEVQCQTRVMRLNLQRTRLVVVL